MHKQVICHACGVAVYEVVKPINFGDTIESSQFRGINNFESPKDGNVIACPSCGSEWGLRRGLEDVTGMPIIT